MCKKTASTTTTTFLTEKQDIILCCRAFTGPILGCRSAQNWLLADAEEHVTATKESITLIV